MGDVINTVELKEYILGYAALARAPERGHVAEDNPTFFKIDFRNGALNQYVGTYVAYHKGILAGQSEDGEALFRKFKSMHGSSSLTVFRIPENNKELAQAVENAIDKI